MKKAQNRIHVDPLPLLMGMFFLSLGFLFYGMERPIFSDLLGSSPDEAFTPTQDFFFFVWVRHHFPTFIHTFAFCLLSAAFFPSGKKGTFFVCLSWVVINVTFEFMQGKHAIITGLIPDGWATYPFLSNVEHFFTLGVFDSRDMLAAVLGGLCAYGLLLLMGARKDEL